MPGEPVWLSAEDVIAINEAEVSETGEPHLITEQGLTFLEGGLARPRHLRAYQYEEDVVCLAAALLYGLATVHIFVQGNKRTAWTATVVFLKANGYEVHERADAVMGPHVRNVVLKQMSEEEFAKRLRPFVE